MDRKRLKQISEFEWLIEPFGKMHTPGIIFANETLIHEMDEKVYEQVTHVAMLPGLQKASYAMPDAHWGYGFPIGGVAAFDPDENGVVSAGGVGFDISCGVRTILTGLHIEDVRPRQKQLADLLYQKIPAGVGSTGDLHLSEKEMNQMLEGGAQWAVKRGYGDKTDLRRIEEDGCMSGARADFISAQAKRRQEDEMGTLGSGNHYLEVQTVAQIFNASIADGFGLRKDDVVLSIHCGSRGLGHQVNTEFLKRMVQDAHQNGIFLPDRELACAPIHSDLGKEYLGSMRAAINCALANRQILTHLAREVFADLFPQAKLELLYDVSHNTCKVESYEIDGKQKKLFIHRKGATRSYGPGHPEIPEDLRQFGQPVLIGGTMGTSSYILAGCKGSENKAFCSACHGAGRQMSRTEAKKRWNGRKVIDELAERGILIRTPSLRGVAEEAPGAYKDVSAVVDATEQAGLAVKVAKLKPVVCIKG